MKFVLNLYNKSSMFRTSVSKQNTHAGDSGDGGVGARENSKMSVPEVHRSYANTNFDLSIPTHWQIYFCIEASKGPYWK